MTIAQEHSFGYSPPNSSPESGMGSMLYDEDSKDGLFDDDKRRKSTGRKGPGPVAADKRATHNAIERARRESLNGRFMTLAEALPSMANVKRPSKSIIVNKALDFVFDAQVKEHALVKENNELRREVDQLRSRLGLAPLPPPAPLLAPAAKADKPKLARYNHSFTTVDSFAEEVNHAMGSTSPVEDHQQSPTAPTPPTDIASPTLAAFPPLPLFTTVESPASSDSHHSPPNPSQFHIQQQLLQAAQFGGYMNPANLISPQHSALLAMHLQQQQVLQQHNHHQQQLHDMYAINNNSNNGWGTYNPSSAMDGYSFITQ